MPSPYSYSRQLKRKTTYRRGPYRAKYAGGIPRIPKSRAIISQAGVGGAQSVMTAGMPLPPEVKYYDAGVTNITGATVNQWTYLQTDGLAGIGQGSAGFQRIGRQIKLVGIVYRMNVFTNGNTVTAPAPYTIDFICDKQPSGAATAPPIANSTGVTNAIYASVNSFDLPNVQGQDRFQFLRRVEVREPQTFATRVSGFIKCNKLVTYDASGLVIADLVQNNILVTFSSCLNVSQQVTGTVRYYYVDA